MAGDDGRRNIVIIGGGIIGCTSAYFLTRHPSYDPSKHTITILEATKIAGGASGKAGGLLALWAYPSSIVPLSYRLHKQLSDEHGGEKRWGYRTLHVGQIDCKGRVLERRDENSVKGKDNEMDGENGATKAERDGDAAHVSLQKRSKEAMAKLQAAGVPKELDWVAPECDPVYDAMGDPSTTAQVHPFQFTTAMAELAAEKGVDVRVGARVSGINYSSDGQRVESVTYEDTKTGGTKEIIPATDIIISAGPWTQAVYPPAPISALRAHSVTIRPSRPISAFALFTQIKLPPSKGKKHNGSKFFSRGGGRETVTPEIYARPHNEVYACGEGDRLIPLPKSTDLVEVDESRCQDIVDHVSAISDELRDGEVTARQACYLPNVNAGNGGPLVGPTGVKGLLMAAGHTCWGIQNGPATGKVMSEFVFEGEARSAKVRGLDARNVM